MEKKYWIIIGIVILLIVVVAGYFVIRNLNTHQQLIGGKDEYGCIPGAGYSWCEEKQKCIRVWEEKCCPKTNTINCANKTDPDYPGWDNIYCETNYTNWIKENCKGIEFTY